MHDLFAVAPKDFRAAKLAEYAQYLRDRDGEMDVEAQTLAKREATIATYETPPAALRDMDAAEFSRQYTAFDRRTPPAPEMLLLLALVKVNSAEAYGVSQNFQRTMARALRNDDDAELRILCEEGYHTRILLSAANRYGIELREPYRPPSALRILIGGIASAPMALARPLTLAGEILATLMFIKLVDANRRVLRHDPETRDAIEQRLLEIATDERGHITYNRLHCGTAELAQTRLILPITARIMATTFPEVVALGAFPAEVLSELPLLTDPRRLPEPVRRQAFVA